MAITTSGIIGQVRLLIADTVDATAIFTDDEITAFLTLNGNDVRLSASDAFLAIAADSTRLSKVIQSGDDKIERRTPADFIKLAETFRESGASVFQTAEMNLSDENFESFRPSWRDSSTAVIE